MYHAAFAARNLRGIGAADFHEKGHPWRHFCGKLRAVTHHSLTDNQGGRVVKEILA